MTTPPSSGATKPKTSLAIVVFPEPDSPTSPRVSPTPRVSETSLITRMCWPSCVNTFDKWLTFSRPSPTLAVRDVDVALISICSTERGKPLALSLWKHLAMCEPEIFTIWGCVERHLSSTNAQRSAKTQPSKWVPRAGGVPGIVSRRSTLLCKPPRGMQRNNPTVYG